MNPEIKERWVAALRSGEYEQGTGCLSENGRFCCLGVLTDLAVAEGLGVWEGPSDDLFGLELSFEGERTILPHTVAKWAGLGKSPVTSRGDLWSLNDSRVPFAEIADLIEREL